MERILKIVRGLIGLGAIGALAGGGLVAVLDPPAQLPSPEDRV